MLCASFIKSFSTKSRDAFESGVLASFALAFAFVLVAVSMLCFDDLFRCVSSFVALCLSGSSVRCLIFSSVSMFCFVFIPVVVLMLCLDALCWVFLACVVFDILLRFRSEFVLIFRFQWLVTVHFDLVRLTGTIFRHIPRGLPPPWTPKDTE